MRSTAVMCIRPHSPPLPQKSNLVYHYTHVETVLTHYKDNASTTCVKIATFRHLFYSIYYCYCGSDGLCGRTHTPRTSTAQNTTNTKKTFKIQNNICGRAVCIVCGPRPVYLNTTAQAAQPMAVDRTTAFCAVV